MKERLIQTLKAWPVITLITIALCFITKLVAEKFNVTLGDQSIVQYFRWYIDHLCSTAAWKWAFFKDLLSLAQMLAQVLVVAPLLEEVVFRWLLWRLPRPAVEWIPAITSSALFSAAHYIQMPWPDDAFVALFFFGMAQCWLYRKTGKLWCPILNHALFNASNLALMLVLPS